MGTNGRQCWFLMIMRDGRIKYATTQDGCFMANRPGSPCCPYPFQSEKQALYAYERWALNHPEEDEGWVPRIEEAEL